MYRAFVDNYKVAVETAEKCCQANSQFAEISEVGFKGTYIILLKQSLIYLPPCTFVYLFTILSSESESKER